MSKDEKDEEVSLEYDSDNSDEDLLHAGEESEFDTENVNLPDSEDDEVFHIDNFAGRYCAKKFETNMKWDSQDELVEWVKKLGKELKMCLVIRRSNVRHVSLTCNLFGEQRLIKPVEVEGEEGHEIVADDVVDEDDKWTNSKKSNCTFELVGVPEKKYEEVASRKWILHVINGEHNHKLKKNSVEHPILGRLTDQEKLVVQRLVESFASPTKIVNQLRKEFPDNCTSERQVTNYIQKPQFQNFRNLTITQWTLHFLKQNKYEVFPLRKNTTHKVEVLFFAHPESLKLLKRFPYVIIIDMTYKTNKYNMPLVEIVGFTCTHKTFNIALAFIKKEEIVHYYFIMNKLLHLCKEVGVMPTAIMTDRELVLINVIKVVFPKVKRLLCWVHIKNNIEAYCSPILKNKKAVSAFCDKCWGLFCSTTEESYEERLEELKKSKQKELVRYVENTWLIPYKENIVKCFTDHHLHFFTRTSKRVEGMHRVLKRIVDSSIGGFSRMIVRIDSAIESQVRKVKTSMEMSVTKMPTLYNKMKPHIQKIFSRLFYVVSDRALRKLYNIFLELATRDFNEDCDDYWMRECQGLPCIHEVANAIIERKPISPYDIHIFWRQIDSERVLGHEAGDPGNDHSMTVNYVGDAITNLEYSKEACIVYTTSIKAKGRPKGSTKWSTKKNSSTFEYAREDVEKENELKKDKQKSQAKKKKDEPIFRDPSDVWASQVGDGHEALGSQIADEPLGSQIPEEPIIHMGVDFGVSNIDYFWYPFIQDVRDVEGDGHCGYRSLCALLGQDERCYTRMRLTLASHLMANRALYEPAVSILNPGKPFESYVVSVNYVLSPCPRTFWCDMPMVGLAFATVFQVALAFLSWNGPCLCLPMMTSESRMGGDQLRVLAMAHVENHNHFIPIWLTDRSPLPPTPYVWQQFKHSSVQGLDETFAGRISMFRDYRILYGRSPNSFV